MKRCQIVTLVYHIAAHELCAKDSLSPFVTYFPAYEIIMDELRDYRYYAEDMVHLTPLAENIIFERFLSCFVDETTRQEFIPAVETAVTNIAHTPLLPQSMAHAQHLHRTLNRLLSLVDKYPSVSFEGEIQKVQSEIDRLAQATVPFES